MNHVAGLDEQDQNMERSHTGNTCYSYRWDSGRDVIGYKIETRPPCAAGLGPGGSSWSPRTPNFTAAIGDVGEQSVRCANFVF